jgi:hypothetical protein
MELPIVVGKNSSGNDYIINLEALPNLFISYYEEEQLETIFNHLILDLINNKSPVQLAVSFSRKLSENLLPLIVDRKIEIQFVHSETKEVINSIDEFISALFLELKNRRKIKNKRIQKLSDTIIVVFIDNIFEVIMSSHKKIGLAFIELLVNGPHRSIYFITGSSGIYKNLLDQLINLSPALKRKLQGSKHNLKIDEPLAAELIINPDGLIFFRERIKKDFVRLFPF